MTNGTQVTANQSVSSNLGSDWHIQGLGDFNGDGKSDVLLRSLGGQLVLWTMNGAQITANQSIENLGLDWHVLGTGDFNGDGKSDILLRNNDSQVVLLTTGTATRSPPTRTSATSTRAGIFKASATTPATAMPTCCGATTPARSRFGR